ncbi:MAG TPA: ABC transporter ATP-binding protein [Limnochordales bacterium]
MAALLSVRGLVKEFGRLRAVDGVDLEVEEGELTAVIGPNGAGKTTLYNLITGRYAPTAGSIRFRGREVAGLAPPELVRLGIGRSFQITNVFPNLTVLQNVRIAAIVQMGRQRRWWQRVDHDAELHQACMAVLRQVGLDGLAHRPVNTLSHGDRRQVEVAIVLATRPKLVLLDEPTAGMNPAETRRMVELIQRLHRETGTTFLLTEHDMEVVFSICRRIVVMHRGRVLADGSPEEIRRNPEVRAAYLGEVA